MRDKRIKDYLTPQRIVWSSSLHAIVNAKCLLVNNTGQASLAAQNVCTLRTEDGPVGILLDFGKELHGGIQIVVGNTPNRKPIRLRIRFGESIAEAMAELSDSQNATNDHSIRDQICLAPWLGVLETGQTGFRFVRIDLLDQDGIVELQAVRATFVYRDLKYQGRFESSDPLLNQIWLTGAYTVHLNMQEYLWDGIKRDRLIWIGDMHPEAMTVSTVFGAHEIVPASLDRVRDETSLPRWMNGISSYSLWWILIHRDWFLFHGDRDYLRSQKEYLTGLTPMLLACVDEQGLEKLPPWRFLDWPTQSNEAATHAGLHALLTMTLSACADIWNSLGDFTTETFCRDAVLQLQRHRPDPHQSKQAAALLALSGLQDAKKINAEILSVNELNSLSTFMGYYVLQARAAAGDYQGCLDTIRRYWGGMLSMGATTFWEDFDVAWMDNACPIDQMPQPGQVDIHGDCGSYCYKGFRHSLCHGWASGPTSWLSEHILGVRPLEPGFRKAAVRPNLCGLDYVHGAFPTPYGLIEVQHSKNSKGRIETEISAPKEIEIIK